VSPLSVVLAAKAGAVAVILFAGLPILTRYGTTVLSRMGASMLHSVGLDDFICNSSEEYEALAISLRNDRERLEKIRERLANSLPTCPLYDTEQFVRGLESSYEEMWENAKNKKHNAIQMKWS